MITLDDIIGMTCLTRDEIEAIGEHEGCCGVSAAVMAEYTSQEPKGFQHIQQMICEDIREALHRDDVDHARALYTVLHHYMETHPDAARGAAG
ncbi:hypothetical protein DDZ14_15265 [Maritimibacter sp. 55A14]|uniref:hypothetical protein n=1 Tax=Maritimibacter sp. 55A14 TaxID=2174844 RepID=UPI000D60E658|nr:hypothetical protein [Maritimibacter sp. 55A14]PWE30515.1 hypothetical protein DDZ14_15265 [Maritimibacter sp. 55A14]